MACDQPSWLYRGFSAASPASAASACAQTRSQPSAERRGNRDWVNWVGAWAPSRGSHARGSVFSFCYEDDRSMQGLSFSSSSSLNALCWYLCVYSDLEIGKIIEAREGCCHSLSMVALFVSRTSSTCCLFVCVGWTSRTDECKDRTARTAGQLAKQGRSGEHAGMLGPWMTSRPHTQAQ